MVKKIKQSLKDIDILVKDKIFQNTVAGIFALVALSAAIVNSYVDMQNNKKIFFNSLNSHMLHIVSNAHLSLDDDFYNKPLKEIKVSEEEDMQNALALSSYIEGTELANLYSIVKQGEKLYFTSSSATQGELKQGSHIKYFDEYKNPSNKLLQFLDEDNKENVLKEVVTRNGGSFRTLAVKFTSMDGKTYVVATDVSTEYIDIYLRANYIRVFVINGFISVLLMFLAVLFFIASKKEMNDILILNGVLNKEIKRQIHINVKLLDMSTRDKLTGLHNRRYFDDISNKIITQTKDTGVGLCVLIVDIDHFKNINDTYGHQTGDVAIVSVAETIKETLRDTDISIRFGGEEFVVLLPMTTEIEAQIVAEKLRQKIGDTVIKSEDFVFRLTASIGISSYGGESMDMSILIKNADEALYEAKHNGRDRVVVFQKQPIN